MKTLQHIIPNLSREEKDRVRSILEMENATDAIETLAQPTPAGIGIRMSNATLSRLKQKLESETILSERGDIREQANALAREEKNQDFRPAAVTLLKEKAFQLALSSNPAELRLACELLEKVDRFEDAAAASKPAPVPEELKRQVARTVFCRFGDVGNLRASANLSDEQKLTVLSGILFPSK